MVLPHQGVFLSLDRSSAQSCHDAVGLIDEFHHLLSLGTEFYEHHGRELGCMRACQRQSGMESPRFLYLYKVAPSRRLSTQKADTTEATNGLGEIVFVEPNEQQAFLELCHGEKRRLKSNVFVNPNEHRQAFLEPCHGEKRRLKSNVFVKPNEQQAFLELCHGEKAKSTRRMKSMVQMRLCS